MKYTFWFECTDNGGGHQAFEVKAENKQEAIKKGMAFAKKHASGDICGGLGVQNDIGVDNMNDDFGALTILAPKCQKCPKVETCDHKQLAHLGYIIPIEDIGISMVAQKGNGKSLRQLEIIHSLMKRRTNYENR